MKTSTRRFPVPHPFLKWVGGKGQLLEELRQRAEAAAPFGRYHEPFAGGAAMYFDLYRRKALGRKRAYLSDNNPRLIDAYLAVQQDVEKLIELLEGHARKHDAEHYYAVRKQQPKDIVTRAARIIYLNKTCYNGLFRENSKGEFNVPMGRYKNPAICDPLNLRACADALGKAKIEQRPFQSVLDVAKTGDFVYFDPPYAPVSKTSSFTAYNDGGFGEQSQFALAKVYEDLSEMGVKVVLSNSMTPLVQNLYKKFIIDEVHATRAVNSRASGRGKVPEALVRNFDL